jgi:hypothetical protein
MTRINPEARMNRMQEQVDALLADVHKLRGEMHDLRNASEVERIGAELSPQGKRKAAA